MASRWPAGTPFRATSRRGCRATPGRAATATTGGGPRRIRPVERRGRRHRRPAGPAGLRSRRLSRQRRDLRRFRACLRGAAGLAGGYRHHAPRDRRRFARLPGSPRPSQVGQYRRLLRQRHRRLPRHPLYPRRGHRRGRPADRAEARGSRDDARADDAGQAGPPRRGGNRRGLPRGLEMGRLERVPDHGRGRLR